MPVEAIVSGGRADGTRRFAPATDSRPRKVINLLLRTLDQRAADVVSNGAAGVPQKRMRPVPV
jgi:hypothetical protein